LGGGGEGVVTRLRAVGPMAETVVDVDGKI